MKTAPTLLALFLLPAALPAAAPERRECVVIQELGAAEPWQSDPAECAAASSPASTFKLPHALIALETGVVADPLATVPWDGKKRVFAAWDRDHSLDSAIKSSVVWFFQRTAAAIGRERMSAWLKKLDYARDGYEGEQTTFWLNGDLEVTPLEQVRFLTRLVRRELPVAPRSAAALEAAFRMPEGKIQNAAGEHAFPLEAPEPVVLRAKTGNTSVRGENLSWLVGAVETAGRTWVFAGRVRSGEALSSTAGAELVRPVLGRRLSQGPGGR